MPPYSGIALVEMLHLQDGGLLVRPTRSSSLPCSSATPPSLKARRNGELGTIGQGGGSAVGWGSGRRGWGRGGSVITRGSGGSGGSGEGWGRREGGGNGKGARKINVE